MDSFTWEVFFRCLGFGLLISLPIRWALLSLSKKAPKRSQDTKWTVAFILTILNTIIILGGFSFSLYGNYLTSVQGSGNMTINNTPQWFADQALNFNHWVAGYIIFLYILLGIVVGLGLWQMIISLCRYIRRNKHIANQDNKQATETMIATKDLISLKEKINTYKKTKKDLDDFFNDIQGDKP